MYPETGGTFEQFCVDPYANPVLKRRNSVGRKVSNMLICAGVCDNSAGFECLQVTPRHAIAGGFEGGIFCSYRLTVRSRSCTTFGNGLMPPFSPLVGLPLSATCSTSTAKPARTHLPGPRSQESRIFQTLPRSSNHQTASGYRVSAPLCWVTLVTRPPTPSYEGGVGDSGHVPADT